MAETRKLSDLMKSLPTTDANGRQFVMTDANGNLGRSESSVVNAMMDGVFVMYHSKTGDYIRMARPHRWTALQNAGEIADGVVVIEGGKILVVAPTEASSAGLLWSSAAVTGSSMAGSRIAAMNDWNGKENTASIISKSTASAVTDTAAYAAGFCNRYTRANANGKGLTAGKWWLPSLGELMMIYANLTKINYCLSLISGATLINERIYWSSTESSKENAYYFNLDTGAVGINTKSSDYSKVRPVSAFVS